MLTGRQIGADLDQTRRLERFWSPKAGTSWRARRAAGRAPAVRVPDPVSRRLDTPPPRPSPPSTGPPRRRNATLPPVVAVPAYTRVCVRAHARPPHVGLGSPLALTAPPRPTLPPCARLSAPPGRRASTSSAELGQGPLGEATPSAPPFFPAVGPVQVSAYLGFFRSTNLVIFSEYIVLQNSPCTSCI